MFAAIGGCVADHRPGPASWIEFDAVPNLLSTCDSTLTSWAVSRRDTGQSGSAACEQPILFVDLTPSTTYTFDVFGYTGADLCWRGACVVTALVGGTIVDCSSHITDLCP
ncbi:MAG: hypothetical protein M3O46_19120 [Myxococcota bacterium]|nr:hypothetical protein [Myxococcota bacterium]